MRRGNFMGEKSRESAMSCAKTADLIKLQCGMLS